MSTPAYRNAFLAAFAACILLAAGMGYLLLQRTRSAPVAVANDPVVARGPAPSASSGNNLKPATAGLGADSTPALAPVQLSPQRMQEIGVSTAVAELKEVRDEIRAPGNVDIDEQHLAYVQTRFGGWIQNVSANAVYQYVSKGQRLFTIYSPELVSTQQEYLLAKQNQQSLAHDPHGMAAAEGGWLLDAAQERLRQFGVSPNEVSALEQTGKVQHDIAVNAPASGFIIERNALPNAYVQPDTKLYTIADLSTVWVYANVAQNAVGRLKPGDPAQVTVDAYPGRSFNGRIDQILPQVDTATRTVRVRLVFRNPGVALKPGMYVNVDIATPLGRQLVIPASGVLQAGTRAIAFVDHGEGNLEPREIELGPQLNDSVVVLKGLHPGDRVVSSANFLVDSESQLQAALAAFNPLPQGTASSAGEAQEQLQIALTTQPSQPRKGANNVQVKLAGADGRPMDGVQVTATFFMPAMPAMGMAAMHTTASLTGKGQGIYEGPLQLDSGGTWQVTIVVQRAGKTIATKQMSLDATGGM